MPAKVPEALRKGFYPGKAVPVVRAGRYPRPRVGSGVRSNAVVILVWRRLQTLLPAGAQRSGITLAIESVIASALEALLMVMVVNASLSVAKGTGGSSLHVPLAGTIPVRPLAGLLTAAVAGVLVLIVHLHIAHVKARLSAHVLARARDRALLAFSTAAWARQADEREGSLQDTVSNLAMQTSDLVVYYASLVEATIGLVTLFAAAVIVDPVVTLVVMGFGGLLFAGLKPLGSITRRRSGEFVAANSSFAAQVSQWGGLALELRVFGVDRQEAARLSDENHQTAEELRRTRFVSRIGSALFRDLAILLLVAALAGLNRLTSVDLAAVGAVVLLILRSLSYAQHAQTSMQQVHESSPSMDALLERLEDLEAARTRFGSHVVSSLSPVALAGVGYDYEAGRPGIDDVTISIGPGEAIGVVGPSGAGKSTLVQVLMRLRLPTRGVLSVAGVPYEEIDDPTWHRLVAFVPQEPKLFQGSVAANISFYRPWISLEQVTAAAAAANVLDDIQRLPNGFQTELGPRGAGLSGGQRQRIAIARALVGEPQMLVLDEPTSALDVVSEQLLQQSIRRLHGKVNLVIIAHRFATLSVCDRVLAMAEGRVIKVGTLKEALERASFGDGMLTGTPNPADHLPEEEENLTSS